MKKIFSIVVTLLISSHSFATGQVVLSPLDLARDGYQGLISKTPEPKNLIGKWKNIGGASSYQTLTPDKLAADLEFVSSGKNGVSVVVTKNGQTGTIYNVSFENDEWGKHLRSDDIYLYGYTYASDGNGSKLEKLKLYENRFLGNDRKTLFFLSLADCTSVGDVYLVCRTGREDDIGDADWQVFARQLPTVPTIKSIDEIEAEKKK